MKHTNFMIAPIFIRSKTLSLKRNSKKTTSVIIALKKRRVQFWRKKTTSVMVKKTAVFTVMALLSHRI